MTQLPLWQKAHPGQIAFFESYILGVCLEEITCSSPQSSKRRLQIRVFVNVFANNEDYDDENDDAKSDFCTIIKDVELNAGIVNESDLSDTEGL